MREYTEEEKKELKGKILEILDIEKESFKIFESDELAEEQKAFIKIIQMQAATLYVHYKACEFTSIEMSMALQHLLESVMWAEKAISRMK